DTLPDLRPNISYYIPLNKCARPEDFNSSPLYKILFKELEVYRNYIAKNINKGFIKSNIVLWTTLILFVPKANRGFCFYVDYYSSI
ncbi:hypothetical protein NEUTE2DRAFT_68702, partial [Neurospora tetrasperma FGSC 2509]